MIKHVINIVIFFCIVKDRKADLVIHTYVDDLITSVMDILGLDIERYDEIKDPTNINRQISDWTIYENDLKTIRSMKKSATKRRKRKKSSTKSPKLVTETSSSHDDKILKPSKISKLNNIDNIIKKH